LGSLPGVLGTQHRDDLDTVHELFDLDAQDVADG
jgi:hypothetical protein